MVLIILGLIAIWLISSLAGEALDDDDIDYK